MFGEDIDDDVADAIERASDAAAAISPGTLDDLLLLELILDLADETVLRALGSRATALRREVVAERARVDGRPRPMPDASDIVRFAAGEAFELGDYPPRVGAIHVVLALFAFQGASSEAVLVRCGIDWRPLRSIVRRLSSRW